METRKRARCAAALGLEARRWRGTRPGGVRGRHGLEACGGARLGACFFLFLTNAWTLLWFGSRSSVGEVLGFGLFTVRDLYCVMGL
jgi:hypothetical protein